MAKFIILLSLLLSACGGSQSSSNPTIQTPAYVIHGAGDRRAPPPSVFLMAGQSNMVGAGQTSQLTDTSPVPNVEIWVTDHWETYQPTDGNFGPEYAFAHEWATAHSSETVGIVKYAIVGTCMSDWQPDWSLSDPAHPQYGSLYQALLSVYKASGSLPVQDVLWDQGECDSTLYDMATTYQARTQALINQLRVDLKYTSPALPFVFGKTQYPAAPYIGYIQNAQVQISQSNSAVCEVNTDGFSVWSDGLHFDNQGQIDLGNAMYLAYSGC